ncbi:MAG TPA: TolC family protein [Planctomycetota bacterium]|nr:TolC family protein [Planctomycetota bacterium]
MRIEASHALFLIAACVAACRAEAVPPEIAPAWPAAVAARKLTRADCVALALRSAPNQAAWTARLALARAELERAKRLPNPTLSLGWEDLGLNAAAQHGPVQTTLSLAVALEDLVSRKGRTKVAKHALLAEEAELRAEMARTASDVARAHDRLVAARGRVALSRELAQVAEAQRAAARKLVAAGVLAAIENRRAEAELAEAETEVTASETEARVLELELAFALGFERPVALALAEGMTQADRALSDLDALLARAVAQRPELQSAAEGYAAELERLRLTAARVTFLPTISGGPRTQGDELSAVASIDAVLPIFDSGALAKTTGEAELLAAAARARQAAKSVASEVCTALERQHGAAEFLDAHARERSARRRRLREDSERLFTAGEIDYGALVLARRDEVEARRSELDAQLALALAQIDLDAALGDTAAVAGSALDP